MKREKWMCVLVLLGVVFFSASPARTERRTDVHGDLIHIGAEEFTGVFVDAHETTTGGPRTVVIDDSTYTVDGQAIFRTQAGGTTTLADFKGGTPVKFYALDSLLTKMWPSGTAKAAGAATEQNAAENNTRFVERKKSDSTLRKEKNVWKN
jgi:hypothetical protein